MHFIREQVKEIADDAVLRWYGAALALVNSLTAVYWLVQPPLLQHVIDPSVPPVCWPFLTDCRALRFLAPEAVTLVLLIMLVAGVLNATLFLDAQTVARAYSLLVVLSVVKAFLLFQDYRLLLNQHYMAYWITVPFLLAPGKRRLLQFLLVGFYIWAGTLKFNWEWISGSGLYGLRPLGLPSAFVPAECVYVIVLEVAFVFGLFARRDKVFWLTLGQLVLFHVSSFWIVGFFYPILMFLLLSVFPLSRYWPSPANQTWEPLAIGSLWRGAERPVHYGVLGLFCVAQLVPYGFPGDPSITGEGRAFALHMFDAPVQCHATATFRPTDGPPETIPIRPAYVTARLSCDPIVYFNLMRDYCRQAGDRLPRGDVDLLLRSRKQGQVAFNTVVAIAGFCATRPEYSMWGHNPWIKTPPIGGTARLGGTHRP